MGTTGVLDQPARPASPGGPTVLDHGPDTARTPSSDGAPASPDRAPALSAVLPLSTAAGGAPESPVWTPPSWEDVVRDHSARVYRLA